MIELKEKVGNIISNIKNNPKLIFAIGLAGILIIFLSGILDNNDKKAIVNVNKELSAEEYCTNLENQLCKQIEQVVGGKVNVMITLETGVEYIYASEAKNNESEIENDNYDNGQKVQKDKQVQNNFILYKDENGNEVPLVVTQIMPNIKGVVIGCENGQNEVISSVVKNLVTTALDVNDDKVCVVGLDISK